MKISVAMCTFNGGQYIEEQLASFLAQVRLPDEVLICDDGSHDNTINIVRSFAARAPFEMYIHCNQSTLGSTKNFDKAVQLCSGSIIALSDQDDVWHPQKLARIEQVFMQNPQIGGLFTDANVVDNILRPFNYSLWEVVNFTKKEQMLVQKGKAFDILLKHLVVTGATFAFRSSWRNMLTPIPACWVHDAWIAFNLSVFSNLSIIQEKLIQYRQHGNNQIGVKPKGIGYRVKESLSTDRELYYTSELERFQVAYNHLNKWFSPQHEIMKILSSKIKHIQTRSHLPVQRSLRIPFILKELIKGKYNRYSTSWQVAIRDLLMP